MSLPLLPTLEEIRESVVVRSGLANSGSLPARQQRWLDEEIRRAHREIYVAYSWLRRTAMVQIPLSAGVTKYDLPNVFNLGGIHRVGLLADDGKIHELRYDSLTDIRNQFREDGKPRYWYVSSGVSPATQVPPLPVAPDIYLELLPAPTTDWPTLVIEGTLRDYAPTANTDRVAIDGEAIIQLVTIRYKEYMGIGGDQARNRADFSAYVRGMRGQEAPVMAYPIASRSVDGPAYWRYPSNSGSFMPYSPSWNPW
jgi:hypothetical protein